MNRVFRDKPGGLVVDYLGITDDLRKALAVYSDSGGEGKPAVDQDEAVAIMLEKLDICRDIFHGFDYSDFIDGTRTIAQDLAETVKKNASIDWEQKESVRAEMRVAVKRILRKYGYPPDMQERATALVIEQAEQLGLDLQAI